MFLSWRLEPSPQFLLRDPRPCALAGLAPVPQGTNCQEWGGAFAAGLVHGCGPQAGLERLADARVLAGSPHTFPLGSEACFLTRVYEGAHVGRAELWACPLMVTLRSAPVHPERGRSPREGRAVDAGECRVPAGAEG